VYAVVGNNEILMSTLMSAYSSSACMYYAVHYVCTLAGVTYRHHLYRISECLVYNTWAVNVQQLVLVVPPQVVRNHKEL